MITEGRVRGILRRHGFWLALITLLSARAWLVIDSEIVGEQADTNLLAVLTLHGHWGFFRDYLRPPVLPVLASWAREAQLPWRLTLETGLLAAVAALAAQWRRLLGAPLALVAAGAVLAHPYTWRSLTEFYREPLLLVLVLALLAAVARLLSSDRRLRWASPLPLVLGTLCALIAHTREGELPLLLPLVLVAVVYIARRAASGTRGRLRYVRGLALAAVPVACVGAAGRYVAARNGAAWGVARPAGVQGAYFGVLSQLHRLRVPDAVRYVPATRTSFAMAAELCPAFAPVASVLSGEVPMMAQLRAHGAPFTHADEIDASRTLWALDWAAMATLPDTRMPAVAAWADGVSTCLARAMAARPELGHRLPVPYPFDPELRHWLPALPAAAAADLRRLLAADDDSFGPPGRPRDDFNPDGRFDRALSRRPHLVAGQFEGPHHAAREALGRHAAAIRLALLGLAGWLGWRRGPRMAPRALVALAVAGVYLAGRAAAYVVIAAAVAPNVRYQVCFAPLFAWWTVVAAGVIAARWRARLIGARRSKGAEVASYDRRLAQPIAPFGLSDGRPTSRGE